MNTDSGSMELCLKIMKIILHKNYRNSYIGPCELELEDSVHLA